MTDTPKTETKKAEPAADPAKAPNGAPNIEGSNFPAVGADADAGSTATGDPSGTVTNRPDGSGTRQLELKPEDHPVATRILPPAEQVNPRLAQAVGSIMGKDDMAQAIREGVEQHAENLDAAIAGTEKIAQMQRDLEDAKAQ